MKTNELYCNEDFVNVTMPNTYLLTTEQVINKPIRNENGVQIGKLTDADEDFIYGIVYNVSNLYKDPTSATVEINFEGEN